MTLMGRQEEATRLEVLSLKREQFERKYADRNPGGEPAR